MMPNKTSVLKSTMYAAVDGSHTIQDKGSKREMLRLVKAHRGEGWYLGNSPTSKVGDTFGHTRPTPED